MTDSLSSLTGSLSNNQRFLLRSVSVIALGLFVNQLLQTAGSIVLARVLNDPVAFGEVNLLLQIFGMITLFLNVGFTSSLVYAFSTDKQDAVLNKLRHALLGSLFFAGVLCLLVALSSPLLADAYGLPALRQGLCVGTIMILFTSVVNIGVSSFSGNRDFKTQAFFMVVNTTFSTLGTVLGVLLPIGHTTVLTSVSFWMGIGSMATALFILLRVSRVHKPRWIGPISLSEMRGMMKFGLPGWAGNIAKAFQQPFLVMMIGSASVVAVGHLANASRITGFIGIVTWAFMIVTFPFVAESSRDHEESVRRGTLCVRYNNLLLYPLTTLICLYPDDINGFLFGAQYVNEDSGIYIRLLALGVLFSSVGRLGGSILAGMGRTRANFWVMIVAGAPVIALVPAVVGSHPVWAVWVYTGGWALSAMAMIGFFFLEGFRLNWWKAYGEPLIPSLAMGLWLQAGHWAGLWFPVFAALGIAALLGSTWWVERRGIPLRPISTKAEA
ncbi:hypothetical protein FE781_14115 [Paenibacillus thermoaerophilus]|nr:hypothetical protein FE781_14115 [Paenibacillus thermoaerophilus]